jgi:iduronate 2-sulfatase
LLNEPAGDGKQAAFSVVERLNGLGRSVRTKRWRYTEWCEGREGRELYDSSSDPGMYCNLAGKKEFQDVCLRLSNFLKESLASNNKTVKYQGMENL